MDAAKLNEHLLAIQRLVRDPVPADELVVMDGKEPRHGSGTSVLTAVTVPSQYYLGSAPVEEKTNEIPVAQKELIPTLDLAGRLVSLDALHTQDETARAVVLEGGGDYLLTVKNNQPTLRANIEKKVTAPRADFPLDQPTPTEARTSEDTKGRTENRVIRTKEVHAEDIGFPMAGHAARLLRQTTGCKEEEVALITSAPPERLNAVQWINLNRKAWGIESGLHQRLDISYKSPTMMTGAEFKATRASGFLACFATSPSAFSWNGAVPSAVPIM